jgi:hypothetical protein
MCRSTVFLPDGPGAQLRAYPVRCRAVGSMTMVQSETHRFQSKAAREAALVRKRGGESS